MKSEHQTGCNDVSKPAAEKVQYSTQEEERERAWNPAAKVVVLMKLNPRIQGLSGYPNRGRSTNFEKDWSRIF